VFVKCNIKFGIIENLQSQKLISSAFDSSLFNNVAKLQMRN